MNSDLIKQKSIPTKANSDHLAKIRQAKPRQATGHRETSHKALLSNNDDDPEPDPVAAFRAKYKSLTAGQICDDLHLSNTTLWRMIKKGDFPKPSFMAGTERRWTLTALEAWHKEQADKIATE